MLESLSLDEFKEIVCALAMRADADIRVYLEVASECRRRGLFLTENELLHCAARRHKAELPWQLD